MDTVLIELTNNRALRLLQELEDLHIIRLLKKNVVTEKGTATDEKAVQSGIRKKASDYKGVLPADLADKMQTYVKQSRDEWQQRI
jgi:hypothetical protein